MRIVITGGHGFIGSLLRAELSARGLFRGEPIDELVIVDHTAAANDAAEAGGVPTSTVVGDLAKSLDELFAEPVDAVFHLASAVSSECEADLDLGLRANLDGTRALLDAGRRQFEQTGRLVSVIFSSSVAVYGSDAALPMPEVVSESTLLTPQSSYGTQKHMCEQLIADYTRRGVLDGRVVRLMTVAVRPGRPNAAASSFVSGIIREPLAGQGSVCPVRPDLLLAIASPRRTVEGILTVAEAERGDGPGTLTGRLPVNLPALTVTVGDMLDSLERLGGKEARARVTMREDPAIDAIVRSWPARFDNARAFALGLGADEDMDAVVAQYIEDHAPEAVNA